MKKRFFLNVLFVVLFTTFFSLYASAASSATKMPSFNLENVITGKYVDSSEFEGKSLLITFFATWCPPCIDEIPNLIELQKKYEGRQFSVVGLSVDQGGKKVVQRLIEKKKINYPVMMADNAVTRDFGGVYGIPTSFLVNSRGNVVKQYTGYVPHSVLLRDVKQVIQ